MTAEGGKADRSIGTGIREGDCYSGTQVYPLSFFHIHRDATFLVLLRRQHHWSEGFAQRQAEHTTSNFMYLKLL